MSLAVFFGRPFLFAPHSRRLSLRTLRFGRPLMQIVDGPEEFE